MIPVNKVYGGFILENLKNFDLILCGTITFSGVGKNIGELNYIMDRFKNDRLVKYRISSKCYWVVEKMGNNNNHIHLMIGLVRGYKNVDDYCKIFAGYWKNRGSCLFVEYDGEGLFGNYMFKNLVEWDFFETEFGNVIESNNFENTKIYETMKNNDLWYLEFVSVVESSKEKYKSKDVKNSLLDYLDKELKEIQDNYKGDLVLKYRKGGKVKEIRCWGDILSDNTRRFTLKCKNEKVYFSENEAIGGITYKFNPGDKNSIFQKLTGLRERFNEMDNNDIKLWYVKKNKDTNTTEIKSIHDK